MPKRASRSNTTGQKNTKQCRTLREQETGDETDQRRATQAERQRVARSNEDEEASARRRAADAIRHQQMRANENRRLAEYARQRANRAENRARPATKNCALSEDFDESTVEVHDCGPMNVTCDSGCEAKHFRDELQKCCQKGKVQLEPLQTFPDYIRDLMTGDDELSKNFKTNIRSYNSSMAFASMGGHIVQPENYGPYSFRLHGQIYHRTSAARPHGSAAPKFAQLYVLDTAQAAKIRSQNPQNRGCLFEIMNKLDVLLRRINPFAHAYKMMIEVEAEEERAAQNENRGARSVEMAIVRNDSDRRKDLPTANEVAIVFFSDGEGAPPHMRDICIHPKAENSKELVNITYLSRNADPMCYPLLFPSGDFGWQMNTVHLGANGGRGSNVTQLQHYQYRLAIRDQEFNPIWNSGNLAQQFVTDAYLKIEANRLNFIKEKQKELRVDMYKGLFDHVNNRAEIQGLKAGRVFILPSSYIGSPRNMKENYQDAMAIVRKLGKPDMFVTMTCNPNWPEIQSNLLPGQTANNRPDLVARVFDIKLRSLIGDIEKKLVFGGVKARIYVIEFQKRGLPHAHILIIMDDQSKFRDKEAIDKIVSAYLPDKEKNPRLFEIVTDCMIHGPCGTGYNTSAQCLDKHGKCTKDFVHPVQKNTDSGPKIEMKSGKAFQEETNPNVNGYPVYRRPNDGTTVEVKKMRQTYTVDNRFVVPYNPWLLVKYNCHINVEICSSVKAVKYLYKYVYKGHDCADIEIVEKVQNTDTLAWDEIKSFLSSRYVCAPEAIWRINEKAMYDKDHTVKKLALHLPFEQNTYFKDGKELEALAREKLTTLTAWFELNKEDPSARQYLYCDIPYHYTDSNNSNNKWQKRKRAAKVVSRMYTASPAEEERYYLRLLLLHVKGAQSFEDIRTVEHEDGTRTQYPTFRDAARERGLLEDDTIWDQSLAESAAVDMPCKMRELFALLLVFCSLSNPRGLWDKYEESLKEDFLHLDPNDPQGANYRALWEIKKVLQVHGKNDITVYGLENPPALFEPGEEAFNEIEEWATAEENIFQFNSDQKNAFDAVIDAVEGRSSNKILFLDGPAGTGKTFTYNTLISYLRGQKKVVLATAYTGIAGNLLKGGTTVNSMFGVPLFVDANSVSNIRQGTKQAELLRNSDLLVIDEASMTAGEVLELIDKLLRDLTGNPMPFGGKVVLLGGDFRQTLSVVKRGNKTKIIEKCLKKSRLWRHFKVLKLAQNMRVAEGEQEFADFILKVGDGTTPVLEGTDNAIEIPPKCLTETIVDDIYGQVVREEDYDDLKDKCIVTPLNKDSLEINERVLARQSGEMKTYTSFDDVVMKEDDDDLSLPIEYLNSLTPSGFPPHSLNVKVGSPIMLLRNLNKRKGLCNGTRLQVSEMKPNVIVAKVMTGSAEGETVLIPRIILNETDPDMPITLRRKQFPVRLAYCLSINKSQGQSFKRIGIYLPNPCFSHGMLYTALSRSRTFEGAKVQIVNSDKQGRLKKRCTKVYTPNIVYYEVLD